MKKVSKGKKRKPFQRKMWAIIWNDGRNNCSWWWCTKSEAMIHLPAQKAWDPDAEIIPVIITEIRPAGRRGGR